MELRPDKEYYWKHFKERLFDRYGIEISLEDYLSFCKKDIELIYKISPNKRFGILNIKGIDVFVVRCNAAKLLNTCFPSDGSMPLPLAYKRAGKQAEDFEADFIRANQRIGRLVQWLEKKVKTDADKKKFFIDKPYKYKDWEYGAAWAKFKGISKHWTVKIVKQLCRKCRETYPTQKQNHERANP